MKRFLTNLLTVFIPIVIGLLIVAFYNVKYDPYGLLRQREATDIFEPNQHALKLQYVSKSPFQFNSFLFGSSRVGNINIENINDGNSWYNMSYSMGMPNDHLFDLEYMIDKKMPIKRVLIAIDHYSTTYNYTDSFSQPMLKRYIKEPSILNYEYLFLNPSIERHSKMLQEREDSIYIDFQIYKKGVSKEIGINEYIDQNLEEHISNVDFLKNGNGLVNWFQEKPNYDKNKAFKDCEDSIAKIIDLCETNQIELVFFVNPMSINYYVQDDLNNLFFIMRKIVDKDIDLYDFSGINLVTTNSENYRDASHYRTHVSDLILAKIFNGSDEYGVKVNKNNFDSLINIKTKEYLDFINYVD
jgi:hypothetical protein